MRLAVVIVGESPATLWPLAKGVHFSYKAGFGCSEGGASPWRLHKAAWGRCFLFAGADQQRRHEM